MTRFDQLLRETIDEMGDEMKAPSAALVSAAITRGRRIRRGRRLTVASCALLAVVAIVLPWAIISRPGGSPATGGPTASGTVLHPGMSDLAGGWVVTSAGTQVLDRASGKYVAVHANGRLLPAPLGDRVMIIHDSSAAPQVESVHGTQRVTVNADIIGDYPWSPTGAQLVGQANMRGHYQIGFAVIDARTGAVTEHGIDTSKYDCSECAPSWSRDGREIIVAMADRSGGEATADKVSRLQLFDATTGAPTRSLPVKAMPSSPFSWSPNGRYVIIANADTLGTDNWQLVDVSTGQGRPFPYDAVWVSNSQLLVISDGKVLALNTDGTVTATTDVNIPGADGPITLGPPA